GYGSLEKLVTTKSNRQNAAKVGQKQGSGRMRLGSRWRRSRTPESIYGQELRLAVRGRCRGWCESCIAVAGRTGCSRLEPSRGVAFRVGASPPQPRSSGRDQTRPEPRDELAPAAPLGSSAHRAPAHIHPAPAAGRSAAGEPAHGSAGRGGGGRAASAAAGPRAAGLADEIGHPGGSRVGALRTAKIRFAEVSDSISEAAFFAAIDSATRDLSGLSAISLVQPTGEVQQGSGAHLGRA